LDAGDAVAVRKYPCRIALDVLVDADLGLGIAVRSRALYVREELGGFAEFGLLSRAMRAPESPIEEDAVGLEAGREVVIWSRFLRFIISVCGSNIWLIFS